MHAQKLASIVDSRHDAMQHEMAAFKQDAMAEVAAIRNNDAQRAPSSLPYVETSSPYTHPVVHGPPAHGRVSWSS
jgi:hypothetical protein